MGHNIAIYYMKFVCRIEKFNIQTLRNDYRGFLYRIPWSSMSPFRTTRGKRLLHFYNIACRCRPHITELRFIEVRVQKTILDTVKEDTLALSKIIGNYETMHPIYLCLAECYLHQKKMIVFYVAQFIKRALFRHMYIRSYPLVSRPLNL